jgi:hypothetical protein
MMFSLEYLRDDDGPSQLIDVTCTAPNTAIVNNINHIIMRPGEKRNADATVASITVTLGVEVPIDHVQPPSSWTGWWMNRPKVHVISRKFVLARERKVQFGIDRQCIPFFANDEVHKLCNGKLGEETPLLITS